MLLRPAVPYLKDGLAHTFFYTQHITTVHVENGKEHVHYEIKKALNETEKTKSLNGEKSESNIDVCILPSVNNISLFPLNAIPANSDRNFLFILRYIEPDDQPPKLQGVNGIMMQVFGSPALFFKT